MNHPPLSAPPSTTVRDLYRSELAKLFTSYPVTEPGRGELHDEIRGRFRELADWLASMVPPCPELWRGVQELHVAMMLCNSAVAANWASYGPSEPPEDMYVHISRPYWGERPVSA